MTQNLKKFLQFENFTCQPAQYFMYIRTVNPMFKHNKFLNLRFNLQTSFQEQKRNYSDWLLDMSRDLGPAYKNSCAAQAGMAVHCHLPFSQRERKNLCKKMSSLSVYLCRNIPTMLFLNSRSGPSLKVERSSKIKLLNAESYVDFKFIRKN